MNGMFLVIGFIGLVGIILVVLDYRDHAKLKKAEDEQKKGNESTFFKDEPKEDR